MIKYYAKQNGTLTELPNTQKGCWINLSPPFSREEIEHFANEYDIYPDFLTDPLDIEERPRYDRDGDVRSIILATPILNNGIDKENEAIYITAPVGIVILPDHVVTISDFENPVIERFLNSRVRHFDPADANRFVLQIMEQTVTRFLSSLKKVNHRRNLIEKELYASSRNMEIKELLKIEKSLVYFVNALNANELLSLKMKRTDFLHVRDNEENNDLFEDIIIDNSQALDMAKVYTDILGGTMDAYASIISNNLNIVMKRLTTITIVLMVPTLVASFFGMNVKIPFDENNQYAFLIVCLVSASFSALVAFFFRRKEMF